MLMDPALLKEKNYNTAEIVDHLAVAALRNTLLPSYTGDFEDWKVALLSQSSVIAAQLPVGITKHLPVRDEVLKLVIKKAYGVIPFDREYVLKNYQRQYRDKYYLFYPASRVRRLCILFSGYIDRVTYNRYSWYFDETEKWERDTAYLFLNDPGLHWYVGSEGSDEAKTYSDIIERVLAETGLEAAQAFAVGASMGGYAALLYALRLGLGGCIAVHPQLTYKGTRRYELGNWERQLRSCGGNFYDVDDLIAKAKAVPPMYLECGDHPADIFGLDRVLEALSERNATFIVHRPKTAEHNTKSPSKERIEALLNFFETFRRT